jgi:hypothetical protein
MIKVQEAGVQPVEGDEYEEIVPLPRERTKIQEDQDRHGGGDHAAEQQRVQASQRFKAWVDKGRKSMKKLGAYEWHAQKRRSPLAAASPSPLGSAANTAMQHLEEASDDCPRVLPPGHISSSNADETGDGLPVLSQQPVGPSRVEQSCLSNSVTSGDGGVHDEWGLVTERRLVL